MSSSDAPRTFSELYYALLARVRSDSSASATLAQAKQYINLALENMHLGYGENFSWCERSATLITMATYAVGTVSVSVGGTSVTGASTLWTTTNAYGVANVRAGGKILFSGEANPYDVASVGGAGSLTLATRYVGSAALSGASYTYFEDEYDLASDFLKPIDAQTFDTNRTIDLISRTDFRRMFPRSITPGKVTCACIQDRPPSGSTTARRRVRFHAPPSTVTLIPYAYVTKNLAVSSAGAAQEGMSADSDEPILPRNYRHGLVLKGLVDWYRDKKDDDRWQAANAEWIDFMGRLTADGDVAQPRMKLQPRSSGYRRSAARPWSGASRRYDTGGRFDRMER